MQRRRVVTGHDTQGRSVFATDEAVEPVTVSVVPGAEFHQMWARDAPAQLPSDAAAPEAWRYFPPADGFRFGFFTLAPDSVTMPEDLDVGAALAELHTKLPGMDEVMEPDHPGMHTTDTVDFDVVMRGEVWLELDDGQEVQLRAGDCVVQNGTRHAWHNRTSEPVTVAVALIGARRDP
jgi:mannose-6-phosphate isomerase-like protein (cupin superfamily)